MRWPLVSKPEQEVRAGEGPGVVGDAAAAEVRAAANMASATVRVTRHRIRNSNRSNRSQQRRSSKGRVDGWQEPPRRFARLLR